MLFSCSDRLLQTGIIRLDRLPRGRPGDPIRTGRRSSSTTRSRSPAEATHLYVHAEWDLYPFMTGRDIASLDVPGSAVTARRRVSFGGRRSARVLRLRPERAALPKPRPEGSCRGAGDRRGTRNGPTGPPGAGRFSSAGERLARRRRRSAGHQGRTLPRVASSATRFSRRTVAGDGATTELRDWLWCSRAATPPRLGRTRRVTRTPFACCRPTGSRTERALDTTGETSAAAALGARFAASPRRIGSTPHQILSPSNIRRRMTADQQQQRLCRSLCRF